MKLPKILTTKDPAGFKNKRVRMEYVCNELHAELEGSEMNFSEMMAFRNEGANPQEIKKRLQGDGYLFANLGLSTILTTTIDNDHYNLVVKQDRLDLGDVVAKPVSGYVDLSSLKEPMDALDEELSEEFLPCSKEGKILTGLKNLKFLPRPFEDVAEYDSNLVYQLVESDLYDAPGLVDSPIFMEGDKLLGNPKIYFQVPSNSAQLIYNYHVSLPNIPNKKLDLKHAEISYIKSNKSTLNHSEDAFNPEKNTLEVKLHEQGLLLIKMKDNDLTDEVYNFKDGKLKPFKEDLLLSEMFTPKDEGMAIEQSILLSDYLKK